MQTVNPDALFQIIEEEAYKKKIDELERRFGKIDELKAAICHALQRASFAESQYAERMRLPLSVSNLRLLPFNYDKIYPGLPVFYVLNEIKESERIVILIDLIGPYY